MMDDNLGLLALLAKNKQQNQADQSPIPLPNGGLEGDALAQQIALNPGPVATTGLNPNNPGPDDIRNKSLFDRVSAVMQNQAQAGNLAAPAPTPALAKGGANRAPAAASDDQDEVQTSQAAPAAQKDPYGRELNDAALKAAQQKAKDINAASLMARASSTMAEALSKGAYKDNSGFADALAKTSDQGVKDIMQRRAASDQDLAHQKALYELSTEKDKTDPNSSVSKMSRDILKSMSQRIGMNLGNIDNMSLSSLEKIYGPLERYFGMVEASENRKAMAEDRKATRASDNQDKALKNAIAAAESFRGDRAAAQAQLDIYNANKAQGLINMYGDPNKLSPQMVGLLTAEIAKVAKGGTPDREEFKLLANPSVQSKLSGLMSAVMNKPTPANAAAFVKQYNDYANVLKKEAQDVVKKKYGRLAEGFKDQMGDKNYNVFKKTYVDPYVEGEEQSEAQIHNDPRVDSFMQANGIKDRAEAIKILKENGKI